MSHVRVDKCPHLLCRSGPGAKLGDKRGSMSHVRVDTLCTCGYGPVGSDLVCLVVFHTFCVVLSIN